MMNFALKMMNFALEMMNFVLKTGEDGKKSGSPTGGHGGNHSQVRTQEIYQSPACFTDLLIALPVRRLQRCQASVTDSPCCVRVRFALKIMGFALKHDEFCTEK